jgi:hypothetical protein
MIEGARDEPFTERNNTMTRGWLLLVVVLMGCSSTPEERRARFEHVHMDAVAALARACAAAPAVRAALDHASPTVVALGPEAAAAARAAAAGQTIAEDVCLIVQPILAEEAAKAASTPNDRS